MSEYPKFSGFAVNGMLNIFVECHQMINDDNDSYQ